MKNRITKVTMSLHPTSEVHFIHINRANATQRAYRKNRDSLSFKRMADVLNNLACGDKPPFLAVDYLERTTFISHRIR